MELGHTAWWTGLRVHMLLLNNFDGLFVYHVAKIEYFYNACFLFAQAAIALTIIVFL